MLWLVKKSVTSSKLHIVCGHSTNIFSDYFIILVVFLYVIMHKVSSLPKVQGPLTFTKT